jgi:hypothetical protein
MKMVKNRIKYSVNIDYLNEFVTIKNFIINIDQGLAKFPELVKFLKKFPRRTYEERALIYNYDLKSADKETIEKLNNYTKEINRKVKKNKITRQQLKKIIDNIYFMISGRNVFE